MVHPKLICPSCAARGDDLYESFDGVHVICTKCGTRVERSSLRCAVEPNHIVPTINRTPLQGYRRVDMNQKERELLADYLKQSNARIITADIGKPKEAITL